MLKSVHQKSATGILKSWTVMQSCGTMPYSGLPTQIEKSGCSIGMYLCL